MSLVSDRVVAAATATLSAALTPLGIKVYRRRARALNQSDGRALIVGLAAARGERYGSDGSTDWRITLRLVAIGRTLDGDPISNADSLASEVMLAAHNALVANPTLGVAGLDWDNGFSLAEDDEDLDEDITALVALYEYQICTQGTSAAIAA